MNLQRIRLVGILLMCFGGLGLLGGLLGWALAPDWLAEEILSTSQRPDRPVAWPREIGVEERMVT
jgi:hypothetical protein